MTARTLELQRLIRRRKQRMKGLRMIVLATEIRTRLALAARE